MSSPGDSRREGATDQAPTTGAVGGAGAVNGGDGTATPHAPTPPSFAVPDDLFPDAAGDPSHELAPMSAADLLREVPAAELAARWHALCAYRQLAPVPRLMGLLREIDPALGPNTQRWVLSAFLRDPTSRAVGVAEDRDLIIRLLRALTARALREGSEVDDEFAAELVARSLCKDEGNEGGDAGDGADATREDGGADAASAGGWASRAPRLWGPSRGQGVAAVDAAVPEAFRPLGGWRIKLWAYADPCDTGAAEDERPAARATPPVPPADSDASLGAPMRAPSSPIAPSSSPIVPSPPPIVRTLQQLAPHELATTSGGVTVGSSSAGLVALRVSRDMLAGGTGCHEWEAGFALAERLLGLGASLRGREVLELGCGAGLVGVALARTSAASILLTDANEHALENAHGNLLLNGVDAGAWDCVQPWGGTRRWQPVQDGRAERADGRGSGEKEESGSPQETGHEGGSSSSPTRDPRRVRLGVLDWRKVPGGLRPDVVVGSDLLYDPGNIDPILELLGRILCREGGVDAGEGDGAEGPRGGACQARGSREAPSGAAPTTPYALIATTLRNEATMELFKAAAEAHPLLCVEDVTDAWGAEAEVGDADGRSPDGSPAHPSVPPPRPPHACPRFQHNDRLDGARRRVLLHKLWPR